MSDPTRSKATVNATASVTFRQRPDILLMVLRVRATEATLDLGLVGLKKQCAEASIRLTRLGSAKVSVGEPHWDDQAELDPMAKMRAAVPKRVRPGEPAIQSRRGVNVVLSATWDIAKLSAEETLALVDHLGFEVAADAEVKPEAQEVPSDWANPEEQIRQMMAQFTEPPAEDRSPKFLYIAQMDESRQIAAATEAHARARGRAERFAIAAGRRLGEISSLHPGYASDCRTDKLMEKQRCSAWLAGCCYDLNDGTSVSEDARAVEFTASVSANFYLE